MFSWVSDARKPIFQPGHYLHRYHRDPHLAPIWRTLPRLLASGTIRICMPTNHRHFTARRVAAAVDQPWSNRSSRRLPVQVGRVSRSLLTFGPHRDSQPFLRSREGREYVIVVGSNRLLLFVTYSFSSFFFGVVMC